MNKFTSFILNHSDDDISALLLAREKWPEIDIRKAAETISSRKKLKNKVPEWHEVPELVLPRSLSAEQCSSTWTARYKAALARRIADSLPGKSGGIPSRIADLTGGLGVDAWMFAGFFDEVLYNEMDGILSDAARHNFRLLGKENIRVVSKELAPGGTGGILGDFVPDIIYLDPARRGKEGRKVFLPEDCSPDIMALKDELMEHAGCVMVKLSPMADIDMLAGRLGKECREIHCVSNGNECKELVVVMRKDAADADTVITACEAGNIFTFTKGEEKEAAAEIAGSPEEISGYLFEPGKALMKTGAFNLVGKRFGLKKAGRSTHVYFAGTAGEIEKAAPFGKVFKIKKAMPLGNKSCREAGREFPHSEVTAKNIHMTSEQLRKKLGAVSGDDAHIFGIRCDFAAHGDCMLVICERIPD